MAIFLVPFLSFVVLLATVCASATPALAEPAVTFPTLPRGGCGPSNVEGWEFQTTTSVTVSALGVYDSYDFGEAAGIPIPPGDGLNFSIPVGLYDSACAQLASVTIPAGTTATLIGSYRYVGIAPLVLPSGQTFRIAAVMRCDDNTPEVDSLTSTEVSIAPGLTNVLTKRIGSGSSLECPTEPGSSFEFAPNFLIGPACGNGVVQDVEQCDDGNTTDGDCCSSSCQLEPDDAPCTDDGLYCSGAETCQDGSCTSSGDPCTEGTCDEPTDQCLLASPTPTATPTAPDTATRTLTATGTVTRTASASALPTATATRTASNVVTPTTTASRSATPAATPTRTASDGATPTGTATPMATGSATATLAAAETATATPSSQASITPAPTATDTPATVPCVGDCDGNGEVGINELILGVNIALGNQPLDACRAFDPSGNGGVEINELISAVNSALNGCL